MTPELKAKWIEALRSGEYEQGDGALFSNGKYCCLGVLLAITKDDFNQRYQGFISSGVAARIGIPVAPQEQVERFTDSGCSTVEENETSSFQLQAAARNDSGWSFREIADWIEQQPLEATA
jgi:hypothetical protein